MARQLRGRGEEVGLVAILDSYAPHPFDALPAQELRRLRRKQLLERFTYHASNMLFKRGRWEYLRKKTKTLRRRAMTSIWTKVYQYYSRISQPLPPALMRVEEFNTIAVKKYDPDPYPGSVTLFPPRIKSLGEPPDPEQGWGRLAQGGVEIHEVDGDHLSMLREPDVQSVAHELKECLEREMGRHAGR
jgi:thioesterase domain-containing protein